MSKLVIIVNALHLKRTSFKKVADFRKKIARLLPLLRLATSTTFLLQCRLTEISITSLKFTVTKQLFPLSIPIIYVTQTKIRRPNWTSILINMRKGLPFYLTLMASWIIRLRICGSVFSLAYISSIACLLSL